MPVLTYKLRLITVSPLPLRSARASRLRHRCWPGPAGASRFFLASPAGYAGARTNPGGAHAHRRNGNRGAFAAGLAAVPVSTAQAQYYPPCSPFPLLWPFCAAGAVVGAAATIVTAPFWALTGTPPYYYGYYREPYFPPPAYNTPGCYPSRVPAHLPGPGYTPQPTYTSRARRSGGNIARELNRQELNRLERAPTNPLPLHY